MFLKLVGLFDQLLLACQTEEVKSYGEYSKNSTINKGVKNVGRVPLKRIGANDQR